MNILIQDLRYGFRMLLKRPSFTLLSILVLALGIGANSAIFSVIYSVLIHPLPFKDSEALVAVFSRGREGGQMPSAYGDFAEWRRQQQVFERLSAYDTRSFTLSGNAPVRLRGAAVSWDTFELLGVSAQLGRTFLPEEEDPRQGEGYALILSDSFWRQYFNADRNVLGRRLVMESRPYTIIGVMPADFHFPISADKPQIWTTFAADMVTAKGQLSPLQDHGNHYLGVIARLRPSVSVEQSQNALASIAASLEKQYPETNTKKSVLVVPFLRSVVGEVKPALLILFAAVGLVLLIACSNVANLTLAQATTRLRETAIRTALGATRGRLIRQLVTENTLLALLGGLAGLLLAPWGTEFLINLNPQNIPRVHEIGIHLPVLLFTFCLAVGTGILSGLLPAFQSSRTGVASNLKDGGRGSAGSIKGNRLRAGLVVVQISLAFILLSGSILLIKSYINLQNVHLGFNIEQATTLDVYLPDSQYSEPVRRAAFFNELLPKVASLPGVVSAGATSLFPLKRVMSRVGFSIEGRPLPQGEFHTAGFYISTVDYFKAMNIPLLNGRVFDERDHNRSPLVVIINEALARKYFPNENPIGKRLIPTASLSEEQPPAREIVGVVGNVRSANLSAEPQDAIYLPYSQFPVSSMTLTIRTANDPTSIASAVQNEVRRLDSEVVVYNPKTAAKFMDESLTQPRFNTILLSIFATLALLLTIVGLYGTMAYSVVQRTHELGVRMALGAQTIDIFRYILQEGMVIAFIGTIIGFLGAIALSRTISGLLYNVSSSDPVTYLLVPVIILAVTFCANLFPALKATRVDPIISLRRD